MAIRNLLNRWRLRANRLSALPSFPASFMFGVATADHQCEAYDPDVEDIRDVWEREHNLTRRGQATDFQHRYKSDVALAQDMGCHAFRFSIAWSRVEPEPGVYSKAEFEYYRGLIAAIRKAGMEPIVTLHHYTWPLHVQRRGGMACPEFPALYGRYVQEVVNRLGAEVRYWIPFNEPNQLVYGYIKPWWVHDYYMPPGLPDGATSEDQIEAVGTVIRNLFLAHTRARQVIKRANPQAQVGCNPLLLGLPIWLQRLVNWNATRMRSVDHLEAHVRRIASLRPTRQSPGNFIQRFLDKVSKIYTILSTMIASDWWHLGMAGKLPEMLCPPECVGQQDFVGLDYYWGIHSLQLHRIEALLESGLGRFDRAPVWPAALYDYLKYLAGLFPQLPLMVIENGCVDEADGVDRSAYLRKHIEQVQYALRDGVDVTAYLCWSITSNREWGLPFQKYSDFGLYHIELDTDPALERVPTPAVLTYKSIIANRGT